MLNDVNLPAQVIFILATVFYPDHIGHAGYDLKDMQRSGIESDVKFYDRLATDRPEYLPKSTINVYPNKNICTKNIYD